MEQMSLKDVAALLGVKAYRVEYFLCPRPRARAQASNFGTPCFWPRGPRYFEGPLREEDAEGEEANGEAQVSAAYKNSTGR